MRKGWRNESTRGEKEGERTERWEQVGEERKGGRLKKGARENRRDRGSGGEKRWVKGRGVS